MIPRSLDAAVACGTCSACCVGQSVILQPDESPIGLRTFEAPHPLTGAPVHMLESTPEGACVYLGADGCTIYAHRPKICRAFSCVGLVRQFRETATRAERRRAERAGVFDGAVFREGAKRIEAAEKSAAAPRKGVALA